MMWVSMEVQDPDKVEVKLTVTATMLEWRHVHEALDRHLPSHPLTQAIGNTAAKLRREALSLADDVEVKE